LSSYAPEEVLDSVAELPLVCIDDLQQVAGLEHWETALFHFFNCARVSGCAVVIAADAAPLMLPVALADLQSRLCWGPVFELQRPSDEQKANILCFRAETRGLSMPPAVANYNVSRAPRDMNRLLAVLEQLDRVSLIRQRPLSVPFVKETLGW
jgi:DnaA family protein